MHWGFPIIPVLSLLSTLARAHLTDVPNNTSIVTPSDRTWLWGWAWGAESTVSIVDHSPVISYASRPAAFGPEIDDPILGYIIPLNSFTAPCKNETSIVKNYGCPSLCVTGKEPTDTWIALVQRGQCEFVKKVRQAQKLGARAVVVGGDDPALSGYPDTLVNMYSPEDSSDIKIASTYIKYSDYMQLYALIANSNTTHTGIRTLSLLITAEYSAWEWYSPIITFVIILLLPSILTFITLLIHRIRASRAAQRERAPEDIVRKLPWRVYTGNGWEKHEGGEPVDGTPAVRSSEVDLEGGAPSVDETETLSNKSSCVDSPNASTSHPEGEQPWFESQLECAICLSEFIKGDKVRVLPCHHIFHLDEVDEWLIQRKKLCPICKADVTQVPRKSSDSHHDRSTSPGSHVATERTPLLPRNEEANE